MDLFVAFTSHHAHSLSQYNEEGCNRTGSSFLVCETKGVPSRAAAHTPAKVITGLRIYIKAKASVGKSELRLLGLFPLSRHVQGTRHYGG